MATTAQAKAFIQKIGPVIQKVAFERGYKYPSAIIAQACLESAYGTSKLGYQYHNYFGMKCGSSWKGKSVNLSTMEEYTVGTYTNIKANFRAYDTMEAGVNGYFDFIKSPRYANLKNATSAKNYLETIKADGYATSSKYVENNYNVIVKYGLSSYDKKVTVSATTSNTATNSKPKVAAPTIRKTSKGDQVKLLQKDLNYLGFKDSLNRKLSEDGISGTNTIYALKQFQKKYKLTVDGIYGNASYNKMKSLLS